MTSNSILLLGAGHMGAALLRGWLTHPGLIDVGASAVIDPKPSDDIAGLCKGAGVALNPPDADSRTFGAVVLAVKPQMLTEAAKSIGLSERRFAGALIVSIAAGKTFNSLSDISAPGAPIVRAMPNLPVSVG